MTAPRSSDGQEALDLAEREHQAEVWQKEEN